MSDSATISNKHHEACQHCSHCSQRIGREFIRVRRTSSCPACLTRSSLNESASGRNSTASLCLPGAVVVVVVAVLRSCGDPQ